MAKKYSTIRYMNDREKENFVWEVTHGFRGFSDPSDMVTYIDFENNDRELYVELRLIQKVFYFTAKTKDLEHKTAVVKNISTQDAFSDKWITDLRPKKQYLIERSEVLFNIIFNGCLEVLNKFDEQFSEKLGPFLTIQGDATWKGLTATDMKLKF